MANYDDCFTPVDELDMTAVETYLVPGATEGILYEEPGRRTYVRLLRFPPGLITGNDRLRHDFDEVVYVLEGPWVDQTTGVAHQAGTIAHFPAGTEHGPFAAPEGCAFLEFRHYPRESGE